MKQNQILQKTQFKTMFSCPRVPSIHPPVEEQTARLQHYTENNLGEALVQHRTRSDRRIIHEATAGVQLKVPDMDFGGEREEDGELIS